MLKRTIAFAMLLSLFTSTGSAEEADCCPAGFQVYVPTRDACFHVYESVMFLRPSTDNLGWGVGMYSDHNWNIETIKPQYHPAFNLDFCYTVPCTGLDAQLNWTHFRSNDSQSRKVDSNHTWFAPFSQTRDNGLQRAHAKVWNEFDAVNFDAGVAINVGPYMGMHFFSGLGAVRIKEKLSMHFGRHSEIKLKTNSLFQGIGPRIGMDCSYACYGDVKFVGGFAATLLFGSQKAAKYHFMNEENYEQRLNSDSVAHTVPAIEANLGLNYSSCLWGYEFTVEGGYMGAIYINALKGYEAATGAFPVSGAFVAKSVKRVQSNFSLDGPYARLNVRF